MRHVLIISILAGALITAGCKSNPSNETEANESRSEVRTMAAETLDKLETMQPGAKKSIADAYGYAVFSNFGMKIFFAGSGSGEGVAVVNSTKAETFMRMVELQAGLGLGAKKFRLVWVFSTAETFDNFVNKGWEIGAQATASAQHEGEGGGVAGAVSVAPGIYLYQITDSGLAAELTAKGTKYYKDDALN